MKAYRVYVPGHRSTKVKAKTGLQAMVVVLNRKGLRLVDVKARAVEIKGADYAVQV